MLAIGRSQLDWGSADQPPLAPRVGHVASGWLTPYSLEAVPLNRHCGACQFGRTSSSLSGEPKEHSDGVFYE